MSIYDLGCGCGRTAQALQRAGWRGRYIGADIVEGFVSELKRKCPRVEAHVHDKPTIVADDSSLDMLFHWSVYTHISPEECYLYLEDSFRALRNGGTVLFSFLEMSDPEHYSVFQERVGRLRNNEALPLLDTFLRRDWIKAWASRIGFAEPQFTHGHESTNHPAAWQTLAVMHKPA